MSAASTNPVMDLPRRMTAHRLLILWGLATVVLLLFGIVLCTGALSESVSPLKALSALFGAADDPLSMRVVWQLRLPRALGALAAGGGLAVSGVALQRVLRNPMAAPSTIGVNGAAVLGANIAIILLQPRAVADGAVGMLREGNPLLVSSCAFLCAALFALLLLGLSRQRGFSPETVVLAGLALGTLALSGTTILQCFAQDTQIGAAVFWTFGDLGRTSLRESLALLALAVLFFGIFWWRSWSFNALENGEQTARALGVNPSGLRVAALLLSAFFCAACVSLMGVIGFVGLIGPHLARRILGAADARFLFPATFLTGCALLLAADLFSRLLWRGVTLPVGAITSLLGGPLFLWLLLRRPRVRISAEERT